MRVYADLLDYKRWFDGQRKLLKLPADCSEGDPDLESSSLYSWTLEWVLRFPDRYLRIWEHYSKQKGLERSQRVTLAYHYGPMSSSSVDERSSDPVDLRIDNSRAAYHMHFGTPKPHLFQDRIEGLKLEDVDAFDFIKAVVKHRSTGESLDRLLGFKVK